MSLEGEPVGGELSHQPVWTRREQLLPEEVAQPVELRPQRRSAAVLLVEQDSQLIPGETPRRRRQKQEDLAVTGAESDRLPFAEAVDDGQQGVRPPKRLQDHERTAAMALLPRAMRTQLPCELRLGHPGRRSYHRHRLRHGDFITTGDVE